MQEAELDWESKQWRAEVDEWIRAAASRNHIQINGPIEQPHTYPWSTVLHIPTRDGTLFFKATAAETRQEAALTQMLAGWFPQFMPDLVAVETSRGWMLMRDGGAPLRASIRPTKDLSPWTAVIPIYGEIQIETATHVPELLDLGLPDWRLGRLPALYAEMLNDTQLLREGQEPGLSSEDVSHLRESATRFAEICSALNDFRIPESINHGDFHDGNVLLKDGRVTLFDWGDANITHPFVSLRTLFVSVENSLELEDYSFTPEMNGLLHLYLESWQRFATMEKLLAAYTLSRPIAAIVKALAWRQTILPLRGALREKYSHILPELLREFLEYENHLRL